MFLNVEPHKNIENAAQLHHCASGKGNIKDLDIHSNLERVKFYQNKFTDAFAKREGNPYTIANENLIEQRT